MSLEENTAAGDETGGGAERQCILNIDDGAIIPRPASHGHFNTLGAALGLARRGLAVFPLAPGAKLPIRGSRGHLDATNIADEIIERWPCPDANVAVATGPVSGVWVLDVDPRHGGDGALDSLIAEHGHLPDTVVTRTPSGGRHYWFRWIDGIDIRCHAGQIGGGLDVRGEGGYVVVPPSRCPSGCYTWSTKAGSIAGAPDWLITLVEEPERDQRFAQPIVGNIGNGQRNARLTSLAGSMRDRGCEADEILALLRVANAKRCDPPLRDREVQAIVKSVMRYEPGKAWWAAAEAEDAAIAEWALVL